MVVTGVRTLITDSRKDSRFLFFPVAPHQDVLRLGAQGSGISVSSVSWVADLRNELHARSGSQKPISKKAKNVWSTRAGTCRKIHCQSVVAGAFCCAVMRENASVPEIPAASKNRIFTAGKIIG